MGASFFDKGAHRPVHRAVADVVHKISQDLPAARRVRDFGMKLQSVKFALPILDGGEVATFSRPDDNKPFRQSRDFVAMAVPNVELIANPSKSSDPFLMCNMPAPYSRRPVNTTWPPRRCAI